MSGFSHLRPLGAAFAVLLMAVAAGAQSQNQGQNQNQKASQAQSQNQGPIVDQSRVDQAPMTLKPDLPGLNRNHRLILKDGTYQMVTQYQIVGDRVRYFSQERDDWEELPANLVDWAATRKWEAEHAGALTGAPSPAMKEAEELDNEELSERADQNARMPEVAKGLNLPDQDGAFVLDVYNGSPELVELTATDVDADAKVRHGEAALSPMAGSRVRLRLDGEHAKVHLHVNDPTFFLSLDVPNAADAREPVLTDPITVKTVDEKQIGSRKYGAHSAESRFAIVHVDERIAMRFVGPVEVSASDTIVGDPNVIPAKIEVMPGKRWLRIVPERNLLIGEYALVEILSPTEMNPLVWDFRVDPQMGDNPGSMGPILEQSSEQ
ncbi:MAG: hypothetical protein ACRD3N_13500 [Terracidiphilus sp.]